MKCKGLKDRKIEETLNVSPIFQILLKVCCRRYNLTRELAYYSLKTSIETLRLYSNGSKLGLVLSSTLHVTSKVTIIPLCTIFIVPVC